MALATDIFDGVSAQLAVLAPGVTSWFGSDSIYRNEAPPRVVWEPTGDTYGPPSQRGSKVADPTARHTCRTGIDAHVWAEGFGEVLLLKDQFIQALRLYLGPNYHLTGGRWVGVADTQSAGKLYVLSFFLDIPVVDPAPQTVTITGELQDDLAFTVPPPH